MSRVSQKGRTTPNIHQNCVTEDKEKAKKKAKEVLHEVKKKDKPKKFWFFDVEQKAEYRHHSFEQMQNNIKRVLKENPNKKLKFCPEYEKRIA